MGRIIEEFDRANGLEYFLSAAAFDIVNFRRFNNGIFNKKGELVIPGNHDAGNWALKWFAENLRRFNKEMSEKDNKYRLVTFARRGENADEFYAAFPNTELDEAIEYLSAFLKFSQNNPVIFEEGPFMKAEEAVRILNIRAGVATYKKEGGPFNFITSIGELLFYADKTEREIKAQGLEPPIQPAKQEA